MNGRGKGENIGTHKKPWKEWGDPYNYNCKQRNMNKNVPKAIKKLVSEMVNSAKYGRYQKGKPHNDRASLFPLFFVVLDL